MAKTDPLSICSPCVVVVVVVVVVVGGGGGGGGGVCVRVSISVRQTLKLSKQIFSYVLHETNVVLNSQDKNIVIFLACMIKEAVGS